MKDGILCLDKPSGMTSRHVDNVLMKKLGVSKVGHLGTLDPFATGVLVVALGKGTKFLPYLDDQWKSYEATLSLGKETSTGDPEGEMVKQMAIPSLCKETIQEAMQSFLGTIKQIPPMTSAIKMNGVPLYRKAHKGQEVEREARLVTISECRLLDYQNQTIHFSCTVSKGTYIRVLGMDIAKRLGTVGYLSALRRTKVGPFTLDRCVSLEHVTEENILDPSPYLLSYPVYQVNPKEKEKVLHGVALKLPRFFGDKILLKEGEIVLAIYRYVPEEDCYRSERGLF